jgi:GTPase SAR1 family protein
VSRHRKQGLEILAEGIWEAYQAVAPAILPVPEPPAPETPPLPPDYWKDLFAQRLQKARQEPPPPEPPQAPEPEPPLPDVEPEPALAEEKSPVLEEPPGRSAEEGDREIVSRLRREVPSTEISRLVPRPGLLARVKEQLLAEEGAAVIGLWGTAGSGKTTLLHMLWRDPEVQGHFESPLWVEVGPEAGKSLDASQARAKQRGQLSLWAETLSVPAAGSSTVDQLSQAIREHLQGRRILILLDDVWAGDSVQPFLVGSRVVFTTRNRALLDGLSLGCRLVEVPPMTLAEAQALVQQIAGQEVALGDPRLRLLFEKTDGLPQALRAATSRIREMGWEPALEFLREEQSRLPLLEQGEGRSRADSIRASFALSYGRLRPEQQLLFRCLGVFAPAPASAEAVRAVWQQKSTKAAELELRRLVDLSLVQAYPLGDGPTLFHLAGLWRDYARDLLRESGELQPFEERYVADQVRRAEALGERFHAAGEGLAQVMHAFYRELPHFDYVYRLACQRQDAARLHRLLTSCPPLLIHAGWLGIWQEWLTLAGSWLEQDRPGTGEVQTLAAEWHLQRAELLLEQGNAQGAADILDGMHRPGRDDPAQQARYLLTLTAASLQLGHTRRARRHLHQVRRLRAVHQDPGLRFWMYSLQARLARTSRLPVHIVQAHGQAILACRAAGNRVGELAERLNLAESFRQFGWVEKALAQLAYVAAQAGQLGLPALYLTSLTQLADLYLNAGQVRRGAEVVEWLSPYCTPDELAQLDARLQETPSIHRTAPIWLRPELARHIVVVGAPGSGKTALARRLSQHLGWPHVELDALYWRSGWKPASTEVFRERTRQALEGEAWVVDGNHWQVRDIVWGRADLLLWLDYSPWQVVRQQAQPLFQQFVGREKVGSAPQGILQPTAPGRGSLLLRAVHAFHRGREKYPIALSLNGLEQLTPQVIHFDSPQSAERWLSEFVESQRRQSAIERL